MSHFFCTFVYNGQSLTLTDSTILSFLREGVSSDGLPLYSRKLQLFLYLSSFTKSWAKATHNLPATHLVLALFVKWNILSSKVVGGGVRGVHGRLKLINTYREDLWWNLNTKTKRINEWHDYTYIWQVLCSWSQLRTKLLQLAL